MIAGRYTLEREVGRGGMGVVWLGRDEVLGRQVALKRIGMFPGGTNPDLERAAREARLAAALNHPHVVAVFDLATDGDEQWLVMEYVEGTTLAGLIQRDGPLDRDKASRVIRQAADALTAAHAAGIVHRDVKPSNMLMTQTGLVKLTDFGIARALADASLTQTGLVTGSPAYLAPEIAAGHPATAASDVWSLGATLYYALAGRAPYEVGDNVLGALYRIVHEDPPRLADAGWLSTALESTMEKEPAARWSMVQLRDFLDEGPAAATTAVAAPTALLEDPHAERTQLISPEPEPEPEPEPQPEPEPTPEPTPAALPLVTSPGPQEPSRSRRRPTPLLVGAGVLVLLLLALVGWLALSGDDEQPAADSPKPSESASASPSPSASPSGPRAEDMVAFVEDYLATVTSNPAQAWQRLTPAFQEASGGFSSYRGFWGGIESATPRNVRADERSMTVSYAVDYVEKGGGTSSDNVTLELVQQDGDYLISGER